MNIKPRNIKSTITYRGITFYKTLGILLEEEMLEKRDMMKKDGIVVHVVRLAGVRPRTHIIYRR